MVKTICFILFKINKNLILSFWFKKTLPFGKVNVWVILLVHRFYLELHNFFLFKINVFLSVFFQLLTQKFNLGIIFTNSPTLAGVVLRQPSDLIIFNRHFPFQPLQGLLMKSNIRYFFESCLKVLYIRRLRMEKGLRLHQVCLVKLL